MVRHTLKTLQHLPQDLCIKGLMKINELAVNFYYFFIRTRQNN